MALTTHPHLPSSAEVKERIELYLYSTSGVSWPVTGLPLPLPLPYHKLCLDTVTDWTAGNYVCRIDYIALPDDDICNQLF